MRFIAALLVCLVAGISYAKEEPKPAAFIKKKGKAAPTLINGTEVTEGYDEVVRLRIGNATCTGTAIAPRVIATAAHCIKDNQRAMAFVKSNTYEGFGVRSPRYPRQDHDLAVIILDKPIEENISFATVGQVKLERGLIMELLGFGCTDVGGQGGIDGKLRKGQSQIIGFSGYDVVSRMDGGSALCFGDSGGPAFVIDNKGEKILIAINSKGNIRDTNYNTRIDLKISQQFYKQVAEKHKVEICGINKYCKKEPPTPQIPNDTCKTIFFENEAKMKELRQCMGF